MRCDVYKEWKDGLDSRGSFIISVLLRHRERRQQIISDWLLREWLSFRTMGHATTFWIDTGLHRKSTL